jgi:hypothetical protein
VIQPGGIAWLVRTAVIETIRHERLSAKSILQTRQETIPASLHRMRAFRFRSSSFGRCAVAVAPFAAACYWPERYWPAGSLLHFLLQIAALLPIYAASVAPFLWKEIREITQAWTGSYSPWQNRCAENQRPTNRDVICTILERIGFGIRVPSSAACGTPYLGQLEERYA